MEPLPCVNLDDLAESASDVGYGQLGKHGDMGYGGSYPDLGDMGTVTVAGVAAPHALSMHPSEDLEAFGTASVEYLVDGSAGGELRFAVGLVDDVNRGEVCTNAWRDQQPMGKVRCGAVRCGAVRCGAVRCAPHPRP